VWRVKWEQMVALDMVLYFICRKDFWGGDVVLKVRGASVVNKNTHPARMDGRAEQLTRVCPRRTGRKANGNLQGVPVRTDGSTEQLTRVWLVGEAGKDSGNLQGVSATRHE